jgi:replicative DNA helicase
LGNIHNEVKNTMSHSTALPEVKEAPHNLDAEQGLLASCLLEDGQNVLNETQAARMTPEYFYRHAHQRIYESMVELMQERKPVDEILLANKLEEAGDFEQLGGHAYLYSLTAKIQTTVHARHWMAIVREKYFLRELIRAGQWTVEQAAGAGSAPGQSGAILNAVEGEFQKLRRETMKEARTLKAVVAEVREDARRELAGEPTSLDETRVVEWGMDWVGKNGWLKKPGWCPPRQDNNVNQTLGRLMPGYQAIIAAGPSEGKSTLARQMCMRGLVRGQVWMFVSLEVPDKPLLRQLASLYPKVNLSQKLPEFVRENMGHDGTARAESYLGWLDWLEARAEQNFWCYAGFYTVEDIQAKARAIAHRCGRLDGLVVDYVQLVGTEKRMNNREQEVSYVSRQLKGLTMELGCVNVLPCQINREGRSGQVPPRLKDLRESGSLEQDADVVLFLWRPDKDALGNNQGTEQDGNGVWHKSKREAYQQQLIMEKNRDGAQGMCWATFHGPYRQFWCLPPDGKQGRPEGRREGEGLL